MSVADLHDLELLWPSSRPTNVTVTGTFDQWSASVHLIKGTTGFFGTVKVPWGQKIAYKFIVDGLWKCRDDRPQEDDGHGNINNVFQTPEKPLAVSPAVHDPPPHLSISLDGTQCEGLGDVETMVTAVEFLPVEPSRSLPLPIPQISVEGLGVSPSADTPVSVSKLDTAAATEGTVSPGSKPAELATFQQAPPPSGVPVFAVNDGGSVSLPPIQGNGEGHDSPSFATHAPIQFTRGESPISSVSGSAKEAVVASSGSAVPLSSQPPQSMQDASALTDRTDNPPVPTPATLLEPTAKQVQVLPESVAQDHRQRTTAPASISQASSPSTPASSTLTHKKRRSLLARIKHIFDKDKDNNKRERKEGNKH